MEFTFEGFLIGVLGVFPGFLSSWVCAVVSNEPDDLETEKWIGTSIVTSMLLNAFVAFVFVSFILPIELDTTTESFLTKVSELHINYLLCYGLALYVSAGALGVFQAYAPSVGGLLHRLRLTPVSPTPNVFCDTLEKKLYIRQMRERDDCKPDQIVPWIYLHRQELDVVGRLQLSSVKFDVDKPVEVFLSPVSVWTTSTYRELQDGMYMRVLPEDVVQILSAKAGSSLQDVIALLDQP
jgi:hypothetical protein